MPTGPMQLIVKNIVYLLTIVLFLVGLFGYLFRHESNYCGKKLSHCIKKRILYKIYYRFRNDVYV